MSALRLVPSSRLSIKLIRSFHVSQSRNNAPSSSPMELRLRDALKTAMKAKDRPVSTCIKSVLADVVNATKSQPDPSLPLDDSGVITTLRRAIKTRTQAAESYAPSSPSPHPENYTNLQSEISLLQSYLPSSPSTSSLLDSIKQVMEGLTDDVRSSKGVNGSVMKELMVLLGEGGKGVDKKELGRMIAEAVKAK